MDRVRPITLVLGAGSSCPFGYPTGAELGRRLKDKAPKWTFPDVAESINPQAYRAEHSREWLKFSTAFKSSARSSIDRFLATRPDFSTIGKRAIASVILEHECAALDARSMSDDWLAWLIDRLIAKSTDPNDWPVQFVTFNYDRSVEFAMAFALSVANRSLVSSEMNRIRDLGIVQHIYGAVCSKVIDEIADRKASGFRFSVHCVAKSADEIRVIDEDRASMKDVSNLAFDTLERSSRVLILGFGFETVNTQILRLTDLPPKQKPLISSTRVGMTEQETHVAQSLSAKKIEWIGEEANFDCLKAMRTHLVSILHRTVQ